MKRPLPDEVRSLPIAPLLAEIASTCNEMLLSSYMLDHAASDAERAWLLSELAESVRTTIYRQTMFAEFELKVHELIEAGEPITASRLNEIYAGIIRDYYGPGLTMDANDGVEWAYIPHFYYKYYVYSYATGLASGISIAERIAASEPASRSHSQHSTSAMEPQPKGDASLGKTGVAANNAAKPPSNQDCSLSPCTAPAGCAGATRSCRRSGCFTNCRPY